VIGSQGKSDISRMLKAANQGFQPSVENSDRIYHSEESPGTDHSALSYYPIAKPELFWDGSSYTLREDYLP